VLRPLEVRSQRLPDPVRHLGGRGLGRLVGVDRLLPGLDALVHRLDGAKGHKDRRAATLEHEREQPLLALPLPLLRRPVVRVFEELNEDGGGRQRVGDLGGCGLAQFLPLEVGSALQGQLHLQVFLFRFQLIEARAPRLLRVLAGGLQTGQARQARAGQAQLVNEGAQLGLLTGETFGGLAFREGLLPTQHGGVEVGAGSTRVVGAAEIAVEDIAVVAQQGKALAVALGGERAVEVGLKPREGLPGEPCGLAGLAQAVVQHGQVVQNGGGVGVVLPELFRLQPQDLLAQGQSPGRLPQGVVQPGQGVEGQCVLGVVLPQVFFPQLQRLLTQGQGRGVLPPA